MEVVEGDLWIFFQPVIFAKKDFSSA